MVENKAILRPVPDGGASEAVDAARRLTVRATASPIRRMGTSVEDGWREFSRPLGFRVVAAGSDAGAA